MATTMPHHSTSWRQAIFAVFAFAFTASQAVLAQQFPDRPITLLVPYAAGGPADQHMRALVDDASKALDGPSSLRTMERLNQLMNYKNEDDYRAFVLETFANEKVRVAKLRQRGLLE